MRIEEFVLATSAFVALGAFASLILLAYAPGPCGIAGLAVTAVIVGLVVLRRRLQR